MLKRFARLLLALVVVTSASLPASAQTIISPQRVSKITCVNGTVGTAPSLAYTGVIPGSLLGWQLCHQAGDANPWLAIGYVADPATGGIRLAPGACHVCNNCSPNTVKQLNVNSGAAGTTYGLCMYSGG